MSGFLAMAIGLDNLLLATAFEGDAPVALLVEKGLITKAGLLHRMEQPWRGWARSK